MPWYRFFQNREKAKQYAALPVRKGADGAWEVCLVTSRGTGRWLIPKGWPKKKLSPHETAAAEALEEAGLVGEIAQFAIGKYNNSKRLHFLASVRCKIEVYPLLVKNELGTWREDSERERRWFSPEEAAEAVAEKKLARIIRKYCASRK